MAELGFHEIKHGADEHLCILIKCANRPDITIDIHNSHGRRVMGTRVNGMTTNTLLIDVKELSAYHNTSRVKRYCPYCGEMLNLVSSRAHRCKEEEEDEPDSGSGV